jgi:hypothetical protein
MKKSITILIAAIILAESTMAQTGSERFSTGKSTDASNEKSSVMKSNSQVKAEMNFMRMNTDARNIEWFDIPGGFQVHYTMEGKNGRSFFDNKGRFQRSIVTYGEKYLPQEVRMQIKSTYYLDYKITNVTEIIHFLEAGKPIYLIQLTNGKVWKKVRVVDGDLELIEEFKAI